MKKAMRGSSSLVNLQKNVDLMPDEIDPYDPAMRATAYNPYGKLLGKPYLKTPSRVDEEIYDSINRRYQNVAQNYPATQNSNIQYTSLNTPRTFHEQQAQKAMYLGTPGQKFTYAALNSEVENSIVQGRFPAIQPFHMRTSMNKIPTSRMNSSYLLSTAGKSGFVTSAYNPSGAKPSSRLEPLYEGMFERDSIVSRGPLPSKLLNEPSAIYIVHYADRNEEWIVRYFMESMITEKNIFRYTVPRNPTTVQISPTQLFMSGGIKQGTRNSPSAFWAIYEWITGDLILLPEMNIARYNHALIFLDNYIYAIGGTDQTHSPSASVEKFEILKQEWTFISKLNYKRSKPLATVSHESGTIYIIGGLDIKLSSEIIESYHPNTDIWKEIEVNLDFTVIPDRTHMLIYNEDMMLARDSKTPGEYDPEDKILFVHYDNIIYPVPDIYFLSISHGIIEELKYDKTNSTVSTYYKTKLIYDRQTKKIIAFSGSNYTVVDYLDVTEEFCVWRSYQFSA